MEFERGYTRQYFVPDPSQLIFTHFPTDKMWQLLKAPVTCAEMEPLVIHPLFAASRGIRPITWSRTIRVDEDKHSTVIKLMAPSSVKVGVKLFYMEDDVEKCKMVEKKKTFLLVQRDGDSVIINVGFPFRGSYSLLLTMTSEEKNATPLMFLSYRIISSSDAEQELGFPKSYEMAATAYSFRLLYWNQCDCSCVCECEAEHLGLIFKAKRGIICSHFLTPGKTRNTIPSDDSMTYNYNTMIVSNSNTIAKGDKKSQCVYNLKVIFPYEGWWTICLNGTKANPNYRSNSNGYVTLMSYHVLARKGNPDLSYPYILTPQVSLSKFDPIPTVSQSIEVPFHTTDPMEFHAHVIEKKPSAIEFESYIQIEKVDDSLGIPNEYKLKARFPKPGKWYVRVFGRQEAKEEEEEVRTMNHGLFSLLVNVKEPAEGALVIAVDSREIANAIQFKIDDNGFISFPDNGEPLIVNFNCKKNTLFKHHIQPVEPNSKAPLEEFEGLPILDHCTFISLYKVSFAQSMKSRPKLRTVRASTQPLLPSQLCDLTSPHRLHASFPWPGKWIVEVFSKMSSSSDFFHTFHLILDVNVPTRRVYYPILHTGFATFGLNIPEESIGYNPIYDSSEFELSLNAPHNTHIAWNIKVVDSDASHATQGFVQEFKTKNANRHFRMAFSTPGVWKALLYAAKDPSDDRKLVEADFSPVIELSLLVKHVDPDVAFPVIYPHFEKYKLRFSPTHLPLISCVHNITSKVVIPLYSPGYVNFVHRMESAEMSAEDCQLLSEMYSSVSDSGLHEIAVRIVRPGLFVIMLWAQYEGSDDWNPVLRHTIKCTLRDQC